MTHPHRYAVTAGEYSDYRIAAIFDTEDQALDYAKTITEINDYSLAYVERVNIEIYAGDEYIGDEEDKQTVIYRLHFDGLGKPSRQEERKAHTHPLRARVVRDTKDKFHVTGTDLTEVRKVFSEAVTDAYQQAQAQTLQQP